MNRKKSKKIFKNEMEKREKCVCFHFAGSGECPQASKAHLTRCDMYYKCIKLPSDNHVWIPSKCPTGLIYETLWNMCVLPGECHLKASGKPNHGNKLMSFTLRESEQKVTTGSAIWATLKCQRWTMTVTTFTV